MPTSTAENTTPNIAGAMPERGLETGHGQRHGVEVVPVHHEHPAEQDQGEDAPNADHPRASHGNPKARACDRARS